MILDEPTHERPQEGSCFPISKAVAEKFELEFRGNPETIGLRESLVLTEINPALWEFAQLRAYVYDDSEDINSYLRGVIATHGLLRAQGKIPPITPSIIKNYGEIIIKNSKDEGMLRTHYAKSGNVLTEDHNLVHALESIGQLLPNRTTFYEGAVDVILIVRQALTEQDLNPQNP